MRTPNLYLVLKLDNGKVVSIANEQTDRITQLSSTVLLYRLFCAMCRITRHVIPFFLCKIYILSNIDLPVFKICWYPESNSIEHHYRTRSGGKKRTPFSNINIFGSRTVRRGIVHRKDSSP